MKLLHLIIIGGVVAAFSLTGCNKQDYETHIHGRVYYTVGWILASATDTDTIVMKHPAVGVQVYLEEDKQAEVPYLGPDLYTTTDNNGEYAFDVFLGRSYDENTGFFKYNSLADLYFDYIWAKDTIVTLSDQIGGTTYTADFNIPEGVKTLSGLSVKSGDKDVTAPDVILDLGIGNLQ